MISPNRRRSVGVLLAVASLPSLARAQSQPDPNVNPKVEIAAAAGFGSIMGDESWRGAGVSFGGAVGVRPWQGVGVGFAVDRLRTQRDFSSDVHWTDTTTLFTGSVSYRFSASRRVQPFVAGTLGAARLHSTSRYPTYGALPGFSGFERGPDELFTHTATKATWGFGAGLRIPAFRKFSLSPELKFFRIPDSFNARTGWQGSIRVGYGWAGAGVPPANDRSTRKAVPQSPARTIQELSDRLMAGDVVYVRDEGGRETRGVVSELSAASLFLLVDGAPCEIREDGLAQIDRRGDRLKNGMLIGMTIGAVTPAAIIFSLCQQGCDGSDLAAATSLSLGWGLIGGGIGAAAGAGIDALRVGRTTVYVSPRKTSGVTVSPLLGKNRQGALVSVLF